MTEQLSAPNDDDAALLTAIMNERDPERLAIKIGHFYHDADRAARTSRSLLYRHIGMLCESMLRFTIPNP